MGNVKKGIEQRTQWDRTKRSMTLGMLAVLTALFFIGLFLLLRNSRLDPSAGEKFHNLDMSGEYSIGGGEWKTFSSLKNLPKDLPNVHIRGYISDDLDVQESIIVPIYGLRVKLSVDGQNLLNFGEEGSYKYSHGPGYTIWYQNMFKILKEPLTKEKLVEIEVENVYYTTRSDLAYLCLNQLQYGEEIVFFRYVREHAIEEIWGVLIICSAILVYGFAFVMFHTNRRQLQAGVSFSFFALVSGIYSLIKTVYDFLPLLIRNPTLCGYLDVFPMFFMVLSFTLYVLFNLVGRTTVKIMYVCVWTNILCMLIAFVFQLSGTRDLFELQSLITIPGYLSIIMGIVCLIWDAVHYKNTHCFLLVFILAPFVLAMFMSRINPNGSGNYIRYGIFSSAILHLLEMVRFYIIQRRVERERVHIEKELVESRVSVMQSQIQPHFLYNSLSTIQILCEKNPKLAGEAVEHFSKYLRANMDSLNHKKCIRFEKELTHLENYLFIEKLRFRNLLEVKYDIQAKDFLCPPLSLQPIVENAVKHGLGKKEEGGTVRISSFEEKDDFVVIVEDNGVGFDVDAVRKEDGRTHVGLENARKRLWEMCRGTIIIESKIGEGTRVTMRFPKE